MGRVLVGCEFSGTVRRAFESVGHEAWSCDLDPSEEGDQWHHQQDVREVVSRPEIYGRFDMMICHPPCTRLAASGRSWWNRPGWREEQEEALDLVRWLLVYQREIPRVCLENPIGCIGTRVGESDQLIQPWMFGHGETKGTCLWLRNLPMLRHTKYSPGRVGRVHRMSGRIRGREGSRTYPGVAEAMADQWGRLLPS